jgi:hypothetical protein
MTITTFDELLVAVDGLTEQLAYYRTNLYGPRVNPDGQPNPDVDDFIAAATDLQAELEAVRARLTGQPLPTS